MGSWKRTFRTRQRGGPGLEEAERFYLRVPHVKGISVTSFDGSARELDGLFAAIVPDAKRLTASKVASARQRIWELLEAAGARLAAHSGALERADYQAVVERWRVAILRLQETARRERGGKSW